MNPNGSVKVLCVPGGLYSRTVLIAAYPEVRMSKRPVAPQGVGSWPEFWPSTASMQMLSCHWIRHSLERISPGCDSGGNSLQGVVAHALAASSPAGPSRLVPARFPFSAHGRTVLIYGPVRFAEVRQQPYRRFLRLTATLSAPGQGGPAAPPGRIHCPDAAHPLRKP